MLRGGDIRTSRSTKRTGEASSARSSRSSARRWRRVLRAETTKSRKQRAVPLRESLVGRLRGLRALHETILGRLANVGDVVFLSPEGRPWARPTTNPMRILDRLLDRAGIAKVDGEGKKLDLHALRTTCGSRLARSGVPLVIAQRWLGHSDPKLTAAHYVDVGVEDLRAATEHLPALGVVPEARQETKTAT
jgi:integrase